MWLLPQRAVWWPAAGAVFVADVHFGKAATFRRAGQPVPRGTTADNLARLDDVLAATGARHLVFLGDFLHAASGADAALWQQLAPWRARHAAVQMTLVRGNHDAHAGDPPAFLGLAPADEPWQITQGAPLLACHHPQWHASCTVLAGHLHPTLRLRGPARDSLQLPCFVWQQRHGKGSGPRSAAGLLVLPAFGAFTGTATWAGDHGATVQRFAIAGPRVVPVPGR